MMVRRHQFPPYLTLTKSCIYARNHTLRTPPYLEKATKKKESTKSYKKGLKSILLLREFAKEKTTSKNTNAGHQFQVYLTLTKSCIYARIHTLRTHPPILGKSNQPKKKSLPKASKRLELNTLSKEIWKGKIHQQKQEFTKATDTL